MNTELQKQKAEDLYFSNKMAGLEGEVFRIGVVNSVIEDIGVYVESAEGDLCPIAHRFAIEKISCLDGEEEIAYYKIDDCNIKELDKEGKRIICHEEPHLWRTGEDDYKQVFDNARKRMQI
jgi:hypothetical protein